MTLLQEVLEWSDAGPAWVKDALRRLFTQDALTSADYDELLAMFFAENGLEGETTVEPVALTASDFPAAPQSGATAITGLTEMSHVNRFAQGSGIRFPAAGLSVVFGHNGAGKSGIARVLKQVCRARVREKVLANAYEQDFRTRVPTANVHYTRDGTDQTLQWRMGVPVTPELDAFMLDESCAAQYVAGEGDVAFQPFGLGHLEQVAQRVYPELTNRIGALKRALNCDASPFAGLAAADTAVGRLLSSITGALDVELAKRLGTLSEEEIARHAQLVTLLAEPDAESKAAALETFAARLEALHKSARMARSIVDDRSVGRWRELLDDADVKAKARTEVESLIAGETLSGTGGETWRLMFEAAKRFSSEAAYVGHDSPCIDATAKCVLCQQDLVDDAKERLRRFNEFVVSDAAQAAVASQVEVDRVFGLIRDTNLEVAVDEALEGELRDKVPHLLDVLETARSDYAKRRSWMLGRLTERVWDGAPALIAEPGFLTGVYHAAAVCRNSASKYREASDADSRKVLDDERAELAARIALAPQLNPLLAVVSNMKMRNALAACETALDTTPVSRKCGTLAARYITETLVAGMRDELRNLGIGSDLHSLRKRTSRGRTFVTLELDGCGASPSEILSEGEKKMAAIAFFLAEMRQSGSGSSIVVDDPVSSLDHKYRRRVAKRLVGESTVRQIVVLTHDAVFLSDLLTECELIGVVPDIQTLEWEDGAPGRVSSGLPWMNQSIGERLNRLDAERAALARDWAEVPGDELRTRMAACYGRVRGTLERLIREGIFNKAVRPFDDRVQVERLGPVSGFSLEEFNQVWQVYMRCNPAIDAHDSSAEGSRDIPTPEELAADIGTLRELARNADERRKAHDEATKASAKETSRE